jgi:Ni/Co efflux regulator RcnB
MRRLMIGMLLAAGAMLPGIAAAQDGRGDHRPRGERPHDGGRPGRGPAPQGGEQPRPQQQFQGRPPIQAQAGAAGERGLRGGDGNGGPARGYAHDDRPRGEGQGYRRPDGAFGNDERPRGFDPARGGAGYRRPEAAFGDRRGADRFAGRPFVPDGPGYRADGRPPIAPGSGGYRPQPGLRGFGDRGGYGGGLGYRPGRGPGGDGWNRHWRDDRRFDWGRYRAENRFAFHLPHYRAPYGWGAGYRRFSPGFTLSTVLFEEGFWIDDPYAYRLPPADGPYRWVRYYDDALLVDVRSGYVVDVVYGIFW